MGFSLIQRQRISTYGVIFATITLIVFTFPFSQIVVAQPPSDFELYVNPDLGTILFYPRDWPYLFNNYKTVFISPETTTSRMGSAFITIDNPVDISSEDANALLSGIVTNIMQMNNFTY
jgi:hypothetical protein